MGGEVGPTTSRAWTTAAIATVCAGVVAALALVPFDSGAVWSSLTPGDCAEYCEHSLRCGPPATRGVVQQPLNAWSSFAYLFVGLVVLRRPVSATKALFATSCAVLAVGSFGFHASVTRELQWLDMVGTYGVVVALAAHGVARAYAIDERRVVAVALVVDMVIAVFKWRLDSGYVLPLLIVVASVPFAHLVRAQRISWRSGIAPVALIAAAVVLRDLDVTRALCWPDSPWLQGHALWHLLTAAAIGVDYAVVDGRDPWPTYVGATPAPDA